MTKETEKENKQTKVAAPKDIEGSIRGYMVTKLGVGFDRVDHHLKRVERESKADGKKIIMVRIFDPDDAEQKGVDVEDYGSLDEFPRLILYRGSYRKGFLGMPADIKITKNN
jgi:hypothetical protein